MNGLVALNFGNYDKKQENYLTYHGNNLSFIACV